MSRTLYVVHCVDTEGPLHVPLGSVFADLERIFAIRLPATTETLRKLRNCEIPLDGREQEVAAVVSPARLAYLSSWDQIDEMLRELMSAEARLRVPDSFGEGYVYSWHCVDHVGYLDNPRRRDIGFHSVFDHYHQMIAETGSHRDVVHFHHHPVAFSLQANHNAGQYVYHKPMIFEILARKIIDRNWFPSTYRPGFHCERPDSHWLLEQYFPFDFANQACSQPPTTKDLAGGRMGDWRRAPQTWVPYHPSHDDYQVPGNCRRWLGRILNVGTRHSVLNEVDVRQAFAEARDGNPAIMAVANHDFRDMRPDMIYVQDLLARVAPDFPEVKFAYTDSRTAMRQALGIDASNPIQLSVTLEDDVVRIRSSRPTFGPQPFLALRTREGRYFHDNLDVQQPFREWTYVLDDHTFPLHSLAAVGVGSCDPAGNAATTVLDLMTGKTVTALN